MVANGWMVVLVLSLCISHSSSADVLAQAESLVKVGDCDAAIELLATVKDPRALQMMADCHKRARQWDSAIYCLQQILACPNAPARAEEVKASIMDCQLANNDTHRALNLLDQLVADHPDQAGRFYYVVGRRYQWMHQYGEAAKALRVAVDKLQPDDASAKDAGQRYVCCALSALEFDSALDYLPTFVKRYPDTVPSVLSSQLYRWKFKIPAAIKAIEGVLGETRPDTPAAHRLQIGLADCYASIEDWPMARATLALVPNEFRDSSAEWHATMAKCVWGQNEGDKAISSLKRAITLNGSNDLKKLLMEYYRSSGDWQSMLRQAQVLQKEWPENTAEWKLNEGWAYLDMKQYERAVPVLKEVVARYPDQRWVIRGALVSLAESLYNLGKGDEALRNIADYYKARPELTAESLLVYGQTMYYGAKDYAQAEKYLRKLVSEYPADSAAYPGRQFLLTVLETAGKWKEAEDRRKATVEAIPAWSTWTKAEAAKRVADGYFQGKLFEDAVGEYKQVLKMQGVSDDLRALVMYKIALCQKELGFTESAKTYLTHILSDYPKASVCARVREALSVCEASE